MPLNEAKYIKKADKGKHIDLFNRKKEPEKRILSSPPELYSVDDDYTSADASVEFAPSGVAIPDKTRTDDPPISKINELLDEYSLWNYLNDYEDFSGKKVSKKERTAIWEMWVESGRPHIYRQTREENLEWNIERGWEQDDEGTHRSWASMDYGKYDPSEGYFDPDTLFLVDSAKPDWMLKKLISEMGHSYHQKYTKYGDEGSTPVRQRSLFDEKRAMQWKERGYEVYDTPGDHEYQVHGPGGIQESLWGRLMEARESPSIKESPFLPGYSRY